MPKEEFYGNIWWSSLYKPKIYQQRSKQKMSELLDACWWNIIQATIDFDLFYNTLGDNFLVKTDRASMAQPIEIRSPFLDIRRIQRSRKVPTKRKTNRKQTKILMREIIKDIVPRSIITRGKKWFEPPIRDWILSDNYKQEIQKWYKQLVQQWVISREWQTFYDKDVFQKDNKIYRIYMVRLYLFITWYQQWISNLK
jgi:asparagine synthase (glutamine-hydrolysing)